MNITLRMTRRFWNELQSDLRRPHAFATERIAFTFGRRASIMNGTSILLSTFSPVADGDYEHDPGVGARIGARAIHMGLKRAAQLRASAFHTHQHKHCGVPWFSRTDLRELPAVMDPFQHVVPEQPRGLLLLSKDDCAALVWCPSEPEPSVVSDVSIVGAPMWLLRGDRT